MKKTLGRHILIEYLGCDKNIIGNPDLVRALLLEAARRSNATIVTEIFHSFNPHGISGVVVIAESHIAIHTWPEYACASVDIFSCSEKMNPQIILDFLKENFKAKEMTSSEHKRGCLK